MIIVDLTQVLIASLMASTRGGQEPISEDLVRHIALKSLAMYRKKYKNKYGELVLADDSYNVWRKDVYPFYKANRKKTRDKDDKDWNQIFDCITVVREELKYNFPYKYICISKCEADDIIGTLCEKYGDTENIMIISGDKDFQQLHNDNVEQWSPNLNKMINCPEPEMFLKEHILKGDKSDGVPNILSNDDCLDLGIRQTPLRKPVLEKYLRISIEKDDKYYRNYLRNQTLIDLSFIPDDIESAILEEYAETAPVLGNVLSYLQKHRLNQLIDQAGDFAIL